MLALEGAARLDQPEHDSIPEMLEGALTDPELLARTEEEIEKAPLSEAKRQQLNQGLEFLAAQKYPLCGPLLLNPLEGSLWEAAEVQGLIERNASGKWIATESAGAPGKPIRGVESIIMLEGFGVDATFRRFLTGLVYGGSGNAYRHGTANEWRLRSLCLFVSLTGYLQMSTGFAAPEHLHAAFRRSSKEGTEAETAAA